MPNLYPFLLLLLFGVEVTAQNLPTNSREYLFSFEIEQAITSEKLRKSSAASQYTFIGEYKKALQSYELHLDWGLDTLGIQDSLDLLKYELSDPVPYLKDRTKDKSLVIISEAHHKPQHRIFTRKILKILYENGFRYLGLETLSRNRLDTSSFLLDTLLNERGYPLNSLLTGYYTREPQMGNLVREALALGFEIFGYERTSRGIDRDLHW